MATATVDALTPQVDAVKEYFAHPVRAVACTVVAGSWQKWRRDLSPPMVIIGHGAFKYEGAAASSPGVRSAPSHWWDLGGGLVSPVVGKRVQTFNVWVHATPPGAFDAADPSTFALDAEIATFALSDLTCAALRDANGHDFNAAGGKPLGEEERGEGVFGAAISWSFDIPIPVLGDPYPYAAAQKMSGQTFVIINGTASTPGDGPIEAP